MKKPCIFVLLILLLTAGNCFAVKFNQIEIVSSNSGENYWSLSTDLLLQEAVSPTVTYYVNSDGPYPMPLSSVFGGAFWLYLDETGARYPGKIPTDFNGDVFTWAVADTGGNLHATGVASGVRKVPLSKGLTTSGDPYHPTISWSNSDPALDDYNIRLFDVSGTLLGQWSVPLSSNPSFWFSGFTFQIGKNYRIRVEARDVEFFDLYDNSGNPLTLKGKVLNRSNSELPYSFGASFNHIEVRSDNDAELGWQLGTACILNNPVSPAISYFVDGGTANPMSRVTMPYYQSMYVYDASVTDQVGGSPADFNGSTFTWTVDDTANDLIATATISSGIRQLAPSTNLAINGDPGHPTVSWRNTDPDLDYYKVRVTDESGNILWQSPDLKFSSYGTSPIYTINDYNFASGVKYKIRIEAREDLNFPFTAGSYIPNSPPVLLLQNRSTVYLEHLVPLKGDLNGDHVVDLNDAIIALQIIAGAQPEIAPSSGDVNSDGRIGLEEALYALQKVAGLR